MPTPNLRTLVLFPLACLALPAHAGNTPPSAMSIRALEATYLDCERRARDGVIGVGEVRWCSEIYETLKQQAFDGDWTRLRTWSELQLSPEGRI